MKGPALLIGILSLLFIAILMEPVLDAMNEAKTDRVTESALACSTSASTTACTLTLDAAHAYEDTAAMTVVETTPGSVDRTGSSSVGSDRTEVTVSGLDASTSYTFDVTYAPLGEGVTEHVREVTDQVPTWLIFLGLLVIVGILLIPF